MRHVKSWHYGISLGMLVLATVGIVGMAGSPAGAQQRSERYRLFNGRNFDGWYTYINGDGKNNDPDKIFTIEDGGVIHVLGKKFGYLGTEKEYDNYRLSVDFKFGERKWPPRQNDPRDAGILYHCVGADKVWMKSLEYQVQEHDCGDMWLTGGEGGAPSLEVLGKTYVGGRVVKWADYERPTGEWNTAVIVAKGDTIQHWINGHVNLIGRNASLTRGKINLQSEGAEIYYRNVILEPLR
jgi:hypothetical protein